MLAGHTSRFINCLGMKGAKRRVIALQTRTRLLYHLAICSSLLLAACSINTIIMNEVNTFAKQLELFIYFLEAKFIFEINMLILHTHILRAEHTLNGVLRTG